MSKMDEVFDLVVRGKSKLIAAAVQEALDEGNAAPDVLDRSRQWALLVRNSKIMRSLFRRCW